MRDVQYFLQGNSLALSALVLTLSSRMLCNEYDNHIIKANLGCLPAWDPPRIRSTMSVNSLRLHQNPSHTMKNFLGGMPQTPLEAALTCGNIYLPTIKNPVCNPALHSVTYIYVHVYIYMHSQAKCGYGFPSHLLVLQVLNYLYYAAIGWGCQ